ENTVDVRAQSVTRAKPREGLPLIDENEIAIELGVWMSGLESFLAAGHHSFADPSDAKALPDSSKEFRLVHSTLQRCGLLTSRLLSTNVWTTSMEAVAPGIGPADLAELASVLRDATLLSEGMIHSTALGSGAWKAWRRLLTHRFSTLTAFSRLIHYAEEEGERYLPDRLLALSQSDEPLNDEHSELALILPRFARILKWLSIVGRMLEADEPLKPALLIFSRINEQIFELTTYINNRLERFPDEEAELFASLDAASYTASIELKKVYSQELAGLARLRPSPSIYARMETAYSLLSEGFQQILAGFAQIVEPTSDVFALFPNFQTKLDQSLTLRRELYRVAEVVQAAEKNPEKQQLEKLQKTLRELMKGTVRFLFYKDTETVERFVEEILVTKLNKDLVPILHRFGAYLDTLIGQVNLRAVLVKHPFDPKR
ncbi:MAG: hypothetical protein ABIV21_05620, partial [Pyrinomonadaceae bacterium]